MSLPADVISHLFSLPADQRYLLAQQLLDSIAEKEAEQADRQMLSELLQRREEMLRGEQIVNEARDVIQPRSTARAAPPRSAR